MGIERLVRNVLSFGAGRLHHKKALAEPFENNRVNISDETFLDWCYWLYLGRAPDEKGRRSFLRLLQRGQSRATIVAAILSSSEFRSRYFHWQHHQNDEKHDLQLEEALKTMGSDLEFLDECYEWLLGRPTDAVGKRHHLAKLTAGVDRVAILRLFILSPEFRRRYETLCPSSASIDHVCQLCSLANPIMNIDDLKKEVAKIKWFHTIDLGNGIITPGVDNSPEKLKTLEMPKNLQGMTVLDIGAWDGFFSFEAERRGARRVLATDSFCWGGGGWGSKAGFDLARRALNSKVEAMKIDVLDISPHKVGVFDLVLFSGVLYHVHHPLLALERVFSVTGKQLILETHVDMLECKRPAMVFHPGAEMNNDTSNWWGPNPAAVEAMLKTVGFRDVKVVSPYGPRMVFHAWQ